MQPEAPPSTVTYTCTDKPVKLSNSVNKDKLGEANIAYIVRELIALSHAKAMMISKYSLENITPNQPSHGSTPSQMTGDHWLPI